MESQKDKRKVVGRSMSFPSKNEGRTIGDDHPQLLSFHHNPQMKYSKGEASNSQAKELDLELKPKLEVEVSHDHILPPTSSSTPTSVCNLLGRDHTVAERKRRQKLSQKFIALSAIIPGLKKMDKASVVGEAARYMKQLQERVRVLEEKLKERGTESVVSKKSYIHINDIDDEDAANSSSTQDQDKSNMMSFEEVAGVFPEIDVKMMDKEVLVIIHCEKQQGLLGRILNKMEMLHCNVTGMNSVPFGSYDMIITLTAQMKQEFSITQR